MAIEHVGIAARSIEEALKFWRDSLGFSVDPVEEVENQKVRVAMVSCGDSHVEILEPTSSDSTVARFLDKRGPGLHHIAIRVDDIGSTLTLLKESGARLIDETPRRGAADCLVAFIHPSSSNGVLVELVERPKSATVSIKTKEIL